MMSILNIKNITIGIVACSLLLSMNCLLDDVSINNPPQIPGGKLYIVESDFATGLLEWMAFSDTAQTMHPHYIQIGSDSRIRSFDSYIYIIESFGADNIIKFNPTMTDPSGIVYQQHLGDNWSPVDMDFVDNNKAYIANQRIPFITVFNPTSGSKIDSINISRFTFAGDSLGTPYANQMQIVDGKLYVAMQRRNGFDPGGNTQVAIIDIITDSIIGALDSFQYKNNHSMVIEEGILYASNEGSAFAIDDGAIEAVNLATGEYRVVISEAVFGGGVNAIVHKGGTHFYVQKYIGWQNVQVVEVDFATGAIVDTIPNVIDAFGGIYFDKTTAMLFVGERDDVQYGVKVFKNNQLIGTYKNPHSLAPMGFTVIR